MTNRGIMTGLGMLFLLSAPSAFARFPEEFTRMEMRAVTSTGSVAAPSAATGATVDATDTNGATEDARDETASMPDPSTATISRIEFTAAVVEKLYTQAELDRCFWSIASSLPPRFTLVFTDVHVDDRFAKHVCIAMRDGIVKGYSDGSFRPNRPINMAESAKILSRAFVLAPYAEADRLTPWYQAHVQALAVRNAIPQNIHSLDQLLTPLDAAEMLVRTAEGITWRPSRRYEDLIPAPVRRPAPVRKPVPPRKPAPQPSPSGSSASSAISSAASSTSSSKGSFWNPF